MAHMYIGESFYSKDGIDDALDKCLDAGYEPMYAPEVALARTVSFRADGFWKYHLITPSVKVRGRGKSTNISHKGGTELVVYAHMPNCFSDPKNIREAKNRSRERDKLSMPPEEFQRLLDSEDGKRCFVIDSDDLEKWPAGLYGIHRPTENHMQGYGGKIDGKDMIAINHPQTKAFLTPELTERYLDKHGRVSGEKIWIIHYDSAYVNLMARLLSFGSEERFGALDGELPVIGDARFAGVRADNPWVVYRTIR